MMTVMIFKMWVGMCITTDESILGLFTGNPGVEQIPSDQTCSRSISQKFKKKILYEETNSKLNNPMVQ